jgi:hypothetical protein
VSEAGGRWQNRTHGGGPRGSGPAQAGREALVDGRRLGPRKTPSLTRGCGKWSWCSDPTGVTRRGRTRQETSEFASPPDARSTTPRFESTPSRGSDAHFRVSIGGAKRSKLASAPSRAHHLGLGRRKEARRYVRAAPTGRAEVVTRFAAARESDGSTGARDCESIAEVGARHLPRSCEASREACRSAGEAARRRKVWSRQDPSFPVE